MPLVVCRIAGSFLTCSFKTDMQPPTSWEKETSIISGLQYKLFISCVYAYKRVLCRISCGAEQ